MIKILAFVWAFAMMAEAVPAPVPVPVPVAPVIPGGGIAHHGIGYGGYGGFGVPVGASTVVKHSEVASAGGYPAAAISPYGGAYGAYGAFPGLGGLGYGYGFPGKAVTQVTTTQVRPGFYPYY